MIKSLQDESIIALHHRSGDKQSEVVAGLKARVQELEAENQRLKKLNQEIQKELNQIKQIQKKRPTIEVPQVRVVG